MSLSQNKPVSLKLCLRRLAEAFPNLEKLVWNPIMDKAKVDFNLQAFAENPPVFNNLMKLSVPFNCTVHLHKFCPNVTELTFTWNKNVTVETLCTGLMPNILKFYGGQITLITWEQNKEKAFDLPQMYLKLMQCHCPKAAVIMKVTVLKTPSNKYH